MSHKRAYSRSHGICIGNLFCIARHSIDEVLEDHLMYEHEHEHEHEDWGSKSGVQMGCCREDGLSECRHIQSISIEINHLTTGKERKKEQSGIKYLCIYLSVHHCRYLTLPLSQRSVAATERVHDRLGLACRRGTPQVSLYLSTTMCRGLKISTEHLPHPPNYYPPLQACSYTPRNLLGRSNIAHTVQKPHPPWPRLLANRE